MKVYELIQELAKYDANTEVHFHAVCNYKKEKKTKFNRDNEDDEQEVTINCEFDDDVEYDGIRDYENARYGLPHIQIDLKY